MEEMTHMYGLIGMLIWVKTTIEMNDELFRAAKQAAAHDGITLRELIERGVRGELDRRERLGYVLPDLSVDGEGVRPGVDEGDWDQVAAIIYTGRGG
jgi:hypothetical protein